MATCRRTIGRSAASLFGVALKPAPLIVAAAFLLLLAQQSCFFVEALTFAMVPKSTTSPFFLQARDGCQDAAMGLDNVTCFFVGPTVSDSLQPETQAEIISELIANNTIDGLAISVDTVPIISPLIDQAVLEAGIPVVTFDSDAPDSARSMYVGTDNTFFGTQIAKVVKNLRPNGGTVGIISTGVANVKEREVAFRQELLQNSNGVWTELEGSPSNSKSLAEALNSTEAYAQLNATAVALMLEGPMRTQQWEPLVDKHRIKDIVYVSGDGSANQLMLLAKRKCHGLVGQLPYEMGFIAIQALEKLVRGDEKTIHDKIIGTNVIQHIMIPLVLPDVTVDENRVGSLSIIGYVLFALTACAAIGFSAWTFRCRKLPVVKASQPVFLIMVAVGVLTMASAMIPLSFDDSTFGAGDSGICMSVPWLSFMGFTITFAALFSKTWRINRIFRSGGAFARTTVQPRDVLFPFLVLLTVNMIILICWTVLDPLIYERINHAGTDGWDRVISTYGACRSEHAVRYIAPLAAINAVVLLIAIWQAYEARNIQSEFSESKYIGIALASMLQCMAMGIPILVAVREEPVTSYLVLIFIIFIISMGVLLLLFVPKIVLQEKYSRADPEQQRRMMLGSVRQSQTTTETTMSHCIGALQHGIRLPGKPFGTSTKSTATNSTTPTIPEETEATDDDRGE